MERQGKVIELMASGWYKEFMAGHGVDVGGVAPNPRHYTGPPMTLGNMRKNGVRSISVLCLKCMHQAFVNVDDQPEELTVPSFAERMRCTMCKSKRVDVRPAWGMKAI